MSDSSHRRKLRKRVLAVVIGSILTLSEFLILRYSTLDQIDEQNTIGTSANKQQECSQGQGLAFTVDAAERVACVFFFKNLRFVDRYHDTLNAISTLAVAIFTATLWVTTRNLWEAGEKTRRDSRRAIFASLHAARAANKSSDVAREEFLTAHRPLFVVHSINVLRPRSEKPPDEQPLRANFIVLNAGDAMGIIISSEVRLECAFIEDAPWRSRPALTDIIPTGKHEVGWAGTFVVEGDELSGGNYLAREETGKELYIYGWLLYENERHSGRRTTYFCRRYDDSLSRFTLIEDPDANITY